MAWVYENVRHLDPQSKEWMASVDSEEVAQSLVKFGILHCSCRISLDFFS